MSRYVIKPWDSDKVEHIISERISDLVAAFRHPKPFYATFSKMLREQGIPVNGAAHGRNLNREIMKTAERYIKGWYGQTARSIADVATGLNAPVDAVLRDLRTHLEDLTQYPALKSQASKELETRARRIRLAQDKLETDLRGKLRATYLHYTTETHVLCPFALAMRPIYTTVVLDTPGGPGAYARHR